MVFRESFIYESPLLFTKFRSVSFDGVIDYNRRTASSVKTKSISLKNSFFIGRLPIPNLLDSIESSFEYKFEWSVENVGVYNFEGDLMSDIRARGVKLDQMLASLSGDDLGETTSYGKYEDSFCTYYGNRIVDSNESCPALGIYIGRTGYDLFDGPYGIDQIFAFKEQPSGSFITAESDGVFSKDRKNVGNYFSAYRMPLMSGAGHSELPRVNCSSKRRFVPQ